MAKTIDALQVELTADINGLKAALNDAGKRLDKFGDETERNGKRADKAMQGVSAAAKIAASALAGIATVKTVQSLVEAGVAMEALNVRMRASLGDASLAEDGMRFVREEAERLGLVFVDAANGFASFSAAATRSGISYAETKEIYSATSEAITAMQLSQADANLVFQALQQIAAKGVVSMEELRQQLGERIPIALAAASNGLGVTQVELIKMVESGELLSSVFLPALGRGFREEIGDSAVEASKSAQAEMNRLKNAIFDLKTEAANGEFMRVFTDAVVGLTAALKDPAMQQGLSAMVSGIATIAEFALKAVAGLGLMANAVSEQIGKFNHWTKSTAELRAELEAMQDAGFGRSESGNGGSLAGNGKSLMAALGGGVDIPSQLVSEQKPDDDPRVEYEKAVQEVLSEITWDGGNTRQEIVSSALSGILSIQQMAKQREGELYSDFQKRQLQEDGKFFRNSISQAANHNRTFFEINKAARLAEAGIDAAQSVVASYRWGASWGGPPAGAAMAAIAGAAQAVNIAAIASASYGGASFSAGSNGGGGVTPTREVDELGLPSDTQRVNPTAVTINLQGNAMFSSQQVRELIGAINEATRDGVRLEAIN